MVQPNNYPIVWSRIKKRLTETRNIIARKPSAEAKRCLPQVNDFFRDTNSTLTSIKLERGFSIPKAITRMNHVTLKYSIKTITALVISISVEGIVRD